MRTFLFSLFGLCFFGICAVSFASGTKEGQHQHIGTPELMKKIHGSIVELLPHSVGVSAFSRDKDRTLYLKTAGELKSHGKALVGVTSAKSDETFKVIAENFASETHALHEALEKGNPRSARFVFSNILNNCISCHTRQTTHSSNVKTPLYNPKFSSNLSLLEKAELNTAIRRFEQALDQYEKAFSKDGLYKIPGLLVEGYVIDYMIVGLKTKGQHKRVIKTLKNLAVQTTLPLSFQSTLSKWIGFLDGHDFSSPVSSYDKILALYNKGQDLNTHPFDSAGTVAAILAGNYLQSYLYSGASLSSKDRARGYLLYGMCELSLRRPQQISKVEYYLEKSITTHPKSEIAKKAYSVLEDHIYFENSGSSGLSVPKEELNKLTSLRKLL